MDLTPPPFLSLGKSFFNNLMVRRLLALGAFKVRSKVWDWSMGSLGVAWYAKLHLPGAGASAGGPEGPGSASYNNSLIVLPG